MKMKTIKTISMLAALALATTHIALGATEGAKPSKADALFDDPVVARGKGVEVKRSQLDETFIAAKANAAANNVTFSEAERGLLEARLLNELVVSKILTAKATDADKAKANEAADKFIADTRKQFTSDDAFAERLKMNKLTLPELRSKLVTEAVPSTVLERELKTQISVTDADVKKFYSENPSKFEQPEMVHAAHILIGTRDMTAGTELGDDQKKAKREVADGLLKRAKAGEDFAALAKKYSEDPGSKDNGGEYTFPRGQMMPEFESAAFALKKGEVSSIVTTSYGYHIIKLIEKLPAKTIGLAEASPKLKEFLTAQEGQKIAPAYFKKLKADAGIEIVDEKLKAAVADAEKAADAAAKLAKP
jgi:peptidyl-prolyl cis-trans isomerase C